MDEAVIQRRCNLLAHRGPDRIGTYVDGPVGLGHRRLAILDLGPAARQPMASEDGHPWITYNGEVYNLQQLRADLERRGRRLMLEVWHQTFIDNNGHGRWKGGG